MLCFVKLGLALTHGVFVASTCSIFLEKYCFKVKIRYDK
jgi:hypothetical protein